jgi:N6-L-threonylcarbamoyladenine synthase
MKILAIESSCDETAAAIIEDGTKIISNVVASSSTMHEKWGGIVPEVAAREQLKSIIPVITQSLAPYTSSEESATNREVSDILPFKPIIEKNIDAIAITVGPGLIGSLLIGIEVAKTIAYVTGKPIIPVNHVLAHMYANFLNANAESGLPKADDNEIRHQPPSISFPAISLVVSGGHTELFLMTSPKDLRWLGGTIDDAAGEAFDKTARLLGFGARGGLAIQEAASAVLPTEALTKVGSPADISVKLPRPMMHEDNLNFSFSGLKTAILREVTKLQSTQQLNPDMINQFAYEVQEAITDVLVKKTLKAAEKYSAKSILLGGGVASNLRLREKFTSAISNLPSAIKLHCPPVSFCTDNAAYIGAYAYFRGEPIDWHLIDAQPDLSVEI